MTKITHGFATESDTARLAIKRGRITQPKARKFWQCKGSITIEPYLATRKEGNLAKPIWTLPRTPEAWDAMEEAGAKAIHDADRGRIITGRWDADYYKAIRFMYRKHARAVLTALALVRPTK